MLCTQSLNLQRVHKRLLLTLESLLILTITRLLSLQFLNAFIVKDLRLTLSRPSPTDKATFQVSTSPVRRNQAWPTTTALTTIRHAYVSPLKIQQTAYNIMFLETSRFEVSWRLLRDPVCILLCTTVPQSETVDDPHDFRY